MGARDKGKHKFVLRYGEEFCEAVRRQIAWAQLQDPAARYTLAGVCQSAIAREIERLEDMYGPPPEDEELELLGSPRTRERYEYTNEPEDE